MLETNLIFDNRKKRKQMSNYHYRDGDQQCSSCLKLQSYSSLQNTTDYSCDNYCSCRFTNERSDKDTMYYNFYVLGKPMNLKPENYKKNIQNNKC